MRRTLTSLLIPTAVSGLLLLSSLVGQAVVVAPSAGTATGTASADILSTIQIINVDAAGLKFGQVIPSKFGSGTVTVVPDGSRYYAGVEVLESRPHAAAHFQVRGGAGNSFAITLPTAIYLIRSGSDDRMRVDEFTSDPSGTGTLNANGAATINVGATLHVKANQPHGRYDAPFTVTVAYN